MVLEALMIALLSGTYHPETKTSFTPRVLRPLRLNQLIRALIYQSLAIIGCIDGLSVENGVREAASWMGYPCDRGTVTDSVADRTTEV